MEVISLSQARHFLRERPIRVNVIDRPRLTAELLCLEPGQEESRQSYDVSDNLYVVIEGEAHIRTTAQEYDLALQDALVVPPGVGHSVQNRGTERLTMLAFVAPKPARASEVRMPRQPREFSQQRDFNRPRPPYRPAFNPDQPGDEEMPDTDIEPGFEPGSGAESPSHPEGGERSFPQRGEFSGPRREFGDRGPAPRRDFGPPRREVTGQDAGRRPPERREFAGGHEARPRRDFSNRPAGPRPPFGDSRPPRRDDRAGPRPPYGEARPPRRDFGDRPAGGDSRPPRRDFGDRPQGPRPPFQARGPRPFGNRPPPRRRDDSEQAEDRPNRRPPVSPNFTPRKPNQTGGSRAFASPPPRGGRFAPGGAARGGGPSRGSFGGRPGGAPRGGSSSGRGDGPRGGGGASRGGGGGSSRPPTGRNARPGPGRSGPRTSGRRPAP